MRFVTVAIKIINVNYNNNSYNKKNNSYNNVNNN